MATVQDAIKQLSPNGNAGIISGISPWIGQLAPTYGVTGNRLNYFLAQAAEETDGFKSLEEYASGAAYEGRTDLGNTQPGDGKKFKGRGIFMTTGRGNYQTVSRKVFGDDRLLTSPQLLSQPEYAVKSALIYWNDHGLNKYADAGDIKGMTRVINGGYNGLQTRMNYYDKIKDFVIKNPGKTILLVVGTGLVIYGLYLFIHRNDL